MGDKFEKDDKDKGSKKFDTTDLTDLTGIKTKGKTEKDKDSKETKPDENGTTDSTEKTNTSDHQFREGQFKEKGGGFEGEKTPTDDDGTEPKTEEKKPEGENNSGGGENPNFKKTTVQPKNSILTKTLSKINALGFETTAVFASDACAVSAISPTRVYSVLVDGIISLIHDLSQTRINVHPSVLINDILSPTTCSIIATNGTKIVTNYVSVMSLVANAGVGGENRNATLGFIAEAIASMSSQGARRFNSEDVLDALRMAAIIRPFRGADVATDWTKPAQTLEQNIPHKLFADSANFTEVLALSNALNNSGDIIEVISNLTSHDNYTKLRTDIIGIISELNTMTVMTIGQKGLASAISRPELIHLAATFSKRDFSTETRTGCFSLSAFDLLLFLNSNEHCPEVIQQFLSNIDEEGFIRRAQDSLLFENGFNVSENFTHHPTGSIQYDFSVIKEVLEPSEQLNMEQLIYLCYQQYFENDTILKDAMTKDLATVTDETTYTFGWFTRLTSLYKFLNCFKQLYIDDIRSKAISGNPLESLIERSRTIDPMSEAVTSGLLKTLTTVETANRMWASICVTFNNMIIDEGRGFSETDDWPLTVDKRRAVKMVMEQFTDLRVPNHYQRFSFNPLLNEPTMYVLRNPVKTNWFTNPGALKNFGGRADLIWILRPLYVELIRQIGFFLLRTKLDRPVTSSDIVRLNTSFTLDALDAATLGDTKQITMADLYDMYTFNTIANRQVISSITDVIVSLEQQHVNPVQDPSSFKMDPARMYANCISMDQLRNISEAIVEVATMASDHMKRSLYITDDLEATVQRQLASTIGGTVSSLNKRIGRGGVLALNRGDLQNWESNDARLLRAKIHLVSTPIYRQTVSDMMRGAGNGQGMNLYPVDAKYLDHSYAITDIFKVLMKMQHRDKKSFTREILTYLSLTFDQDPSAVYIDIATRHLFSAASFNTASKLEDLEVAQDLLIFNESISLWYNQDVLINEPIRAERDLLPMMVDIAHQQDTDVLLQGLFQNKVLKDIMVGSAAARTPAYAFHLSVSNQNRIIYRGVPMNNIIRK